MIKSFFNFMAERFKALGIQTERQSEVEIIKTVRKSYKQEDLILDMGVLIQKYMKNFSAYDKMRAKCYLKRIKKVN